MFKINQNFKIIFNFANWVRKYMIYQGCVKKVKSHLKKKKADVVHVELAYYGGKLKIDQSYWASQA